MCLEFLSKYRNAGFLILRLGIGAIFIVHGYGKLFGGPAVWAKIGGAMGVIGIKFAFPFFGFMAALSEFGGGICLILGLFFRPACFFMFFTMAIATIMHVSGGDGFNVYSHALKSAIIFLSLMFIGPGECTLDDKLKSFCKK